MATVSTAAQEQLMTDADLCGRIAGGDQAAFQTLMRRYNSRLFRVARAILKDDGDAEDALQEAYLDAYRHIGDFRGTSRLGTWLTRIAINHALMRLRKQKRDRVVVSIDDRRDGARNEVDMPDTTIESAPDALVRGELRRLLERRIDELPVTFRTVFVMREIEEMSVDDTAECLGIPPATVRTRLFRAKALLRDALARDTDAATSRVYAFDGARCDRIVANVLARIP